MRTLTSLAFAIAAAGQPVLLAESLPANTSTAYSAVIHFDRSDYFVENRYGPTTPTRSAAGLETAIVFSQGSFMEPDESGHLALPANFSQRVAFVRAASPEAKLTLGIFSLRRIVSNPVAIETFIGELQPLVDTHGFTGIDIDWEDMPNAGTYVSPANYGATVKAIADEFRPQGIVISTSHAHGAQYEPYVAAIADAVDFVNLQFYFAQSNAMDLATFRSRLGAYVNRGLRASQIRIGLPSYGMTAQGNPTSDKWRSWNNLRNAGVDLVQANQWTDPGNGQVYYFSGLNLIAAKVNYARSNGFAGVFTWELTQDTVYDHEWSINRRIDELAAEVPVLELTNSNAGSGTLGTGVVNLGAGKVLNHGILRFARTGTNVYPNAIEGSGRVETTGTGVTVLTGASVHEGGTFVQAGSSLNLGNGGASGSVAGTIQVDGTLTFNRSDDLNISNTLAGTGRLVKAGTGRLSLDPGDLPAGFATFSASGGVVENTGDLEFPGNVLIGEAAGATFFQRQGTVTFSATVGDWGVGVNIGHRNGGNGRYEIQEGTLNVPHAELILSAGGASSGTLVIASGATANLKGIAMGTSATGVARLQLAGGRLNIGDKGISNRVAPAAGAVRELRLESGVLGALADWSSSVNMNLPVSGQAVTIDTAAADGVAGPRQIRLEGVLAGDGGLQVTGGGELLLSGDNTYTGTTRVGSATLSVQGSLSSPTVVGNEGVLKGGGLIQAPVTIEAGGILAPGGPSPLGTGLLTVEGELRIAAEGGISVAGDVALNGARIVVPSAPAASPLTLVSYSGSRTGTFAEVLLPAGWELHYDDAGQQIQLLRTTSGFGAWMDQFEAGEKSGFEDDADGDGIANGLEFVLGGNPSVPGDSGLPLIERSTDEDGFRYTFRREVRARENSLITVKISADLSSWPEEEVIVVGWDTASTSDGVEITRYEDHDLISVRLRVTGARQFVRLEVTEP